MRYSNAEARRIDDDCRHTLKLLRTQNKSLKKADPLCRHISQYAIVVCSGAIERTVKCIIADCAGMNASPPIIEYLSKTIRDGSMNPSKGNIEKLLGKFGQQWNENFIKSYNSLSAEHKNALGSLVTNRNSVAHGNSISIGLHDIINYYLKSRIVVGKLEQALV